MASQVNVISAEQLNQDFQNILDSIKRQNLSNSEIYKLFSPVRWQLFRSTLIKRIKLSILILVCAAVVYYVPLVNWNVSAVGRLLMIQMLPYWNWRPLYKDRCLIQNFKSKAEIQGPSYYNRGPASGDCSVCENIGSIFKLDNVSYDHLNEYHLLRSFPVVISDSHVKWVERPWVNMAQFFERIESLLFSFPCNVQTNLIFNPTRTLKSSDALFGLLDVLSKSESNASWFLHFRNCELKTVKDTRLIIERPYFYASHLEMPYTTWFLVSYNYSIETPKYLKLDGLIIVMQLKNLLKIILSPRGECGRICKELKVELHEGQALVFSTDLWAMEYLPTASNETAVTFISETMQK
ncbi:uncharacterized protein LOC131430281 [Malaya genurostris]|uniref:uncharacterized protein LOC131430281 n=1 Tax=Malaya genurostris TaxID=325434 RepID=UPI0026F3CFEE|nr:uncharacterized protein LOC131430281 [Malaya genurostris]